MKKNLLFAVILILAITAVIFAQVPAAKNVSAGKQKFIYSVMYYTDNWDKFGGGSEFSVKGVSSQIKSSIESAKSLPTVLNMMGGDGWELISVLDERVTYGTQYTYYLKKADN